MLLVNQEIWFHFINDAENSQLSLPFKIMREGSVKVETNIFEKSRTVPLGSWQDVPFNAANFIPSAGTWTVSASNVTTNRYTLIGKTMIWTLRVQGSVTGGALNQYMHVVLPGGVTAPAFSGLTKATEMYDGSVASTRIYPFAGTGNLVTIEKEGGSPFQPGTLYLAFTLSFEIN
jgi:hypothetical protein